MAPRVGTVRVVHFFKMMIKIIKEGTLSFSCSQILSNTPSHSLALTCSLTLPLILSLSHTPHDTLLFSPSAFRNYGFLSIIA